MENCWDVDRHRFIYQNEQKISGLCSLRGTVNSLIDTYKVHTRSHKATYRGLLFVSEILHFITSNFFIVSNIMIMKNGPKLFIQNEK